MNKRTSIKDIADALGISTATVSLVLSGKAKEGRIGKELSERIQETAQQMNYKPNRLARSLRVGYSQTIGLIVADISNPFFGTLALYIHEEAEKFGYSVIIVNTSESDLKMEKSIEILKDRQVDGYIIVPTEHGDKSIQELAKSNTPLVLVDRYFPSVPASYVVVDNYRAVFESTRLLIRLGCKRIALFVYESKLQHMEERKKGYTEALKEEGLFDPAYIYNISYTRFTEDIQNSINKLLSEKEKVEGVFFATNSMALAGIKELITQGVRTQEDIQIASFDKSEVFDFMAKPVSYIRQPIEEMGRKAVDILVEQLTDKEVPHTITTCKLTTELVYNTLNNKL